MIPPAPDRAASAAVLPAVAAAVLLAAAALRLPALSSSPPGVWVDEAIGALQGDALVRGERLPAAGSVRSPRWPLWCLAEGASASVFGDGIPGARLPAAIAGLLGVLLAWPAAQLFGGRAAGWWAAAFLAGSLWHVTASRLALPCVLVVAETLLVGWILLRDEPLNPFTGALVILVCAAAPLGYPASLVTPVLAGSLLLLRVFVRGAGEAGAGLAVLAAAAAAVALVMLWGPDSLQRSRYVGGLDAAGPGGWIRMTGRVALNWAVGQPGPWGYWHNYPPGSPRVTVVELALVLLGAVGIARGAAPRWKRIALGGWFLLSLAPEVAPGDDIHLLRGLPALAPAAILAGAGAAWLAGATGRAGPVLVALLLGVNAARTARMTFQVMPADPVARSWYSAVDREAAGYVKDVAAGEPVVVTPAPAYPAAPLLAFHLRGELRRGTVRGSDAALADPVLERVLREPVTRQPILFVFRSVRRLDGRVHLGISNIDGLLAFGRQALAAGRTREAEAHSRGVLARCPDSAAAHGALGLALAAQGRWREAADHLRAARPYNPPGSPCALALAEAERRLTGNR